MSKQPKEPGRISLPEWLRRTHAQPPDHKTVIRFRDDPASGEERISDCAFFAPVGLAQRAGFRLTTPTDAEVWRAGHKEPADAGDCWLRLTRFPWAYDASGNRYASSIVMQTVIDAIAELNTYGDPTLQRIWCEVVGAGMQPELTGPIPWNPIPKSDKAW